MAEKHPELAVAFMKGMIKVGRWANEHKHAAAAILDKQTFYLDVEHTYRGIKDVDMVPNLSPQNLVSVEIGKDFMPAVEFVGGGRVVGVLGDEGEAEDWRKSGNPVLPADIGHPVISRLEATHAHTSSPCRHSGRAGDSRRGGCAVRRRGASDRHGRDLGLRAPRGPRARRRV